MAERVQQEEESEGKANIMKQEIEMNTVIHGNSEEILKTLPDKFVDCCITSPPYYALRDYGIDGQIGLEDTPEEYVQKLVNVFQEVKRVLKDDGTLWLNIGDSYWGSGSRGWDFTGRITDHSVIQQGSKGTVNLSNVPKLVGKSDTGVKNKDLIGIPWLLAFALRNDGWYLRQDIIWHKPNPMPESVTDRCTKAHEYIFLLSKKPKYYFDYTAIQEPCVIQKPSEHIRFGGNKYGDNEDKKYAIYSGDEYHPKVERDGEYIVRNKRDVWTVKPSRSKEAHFATFPEELIKPCVLAGCRMGGVVLDPFFGSGTTGRVATEYGRNYIGIELNTEYIDMAHRRTNNIQLSFI